MLCGNVAFAAKKVEPVVLLNERFDNYATNEMPKSINIIGGDTNRVVWKTDKKDKQLALVAPNDTVTASFSFSQKTKKVVVSFDITAGKGSTGSIAITTGGTSRFEFLKFDADGFLKTMDGYQIDNGNVNGTAHIAAAIDLEDGRYSIYSDGVRVVSNWIATIKLIELGGIQFNITSGEGKGEHFIDNVIAYEGLTYYSPSQFPILSLNKNEIEYVPVDKKSRKIIRPTPEQIKKAFQENSVGKRPRIMIDAKMVDRLKNNIAEKDPFVTQGFDKILAECEKFLKEPPLKYNIPDGIRLLEVCRQVKARIQCLGLAYLVTGDKKYAKRGWEECREVFRLGAKTIS